MQTSADDSLEREHAPPGSALYYAIVFSSREPFAHPLWRGASIALHALRERWLDIVAGAGEPHIKEHRINWWSDEIMEARDGRPRHPVSIALSRYGGKDIWRKPEVVEMLRAAGNAVADGLCRMQAREDFCRDFGGACLSLEDALIHALPSTDEASIPLESGAENEDRIQTLRVCGRALECATLANPPPGLWAGLRSRSDTHPAQDKPRKEATSQPEGEDAKTLHRQELRWADNALGDAIALITPADDPLSLETETLLRIRKAEIRCASKPDTPRPTSITPLRKLYIAWRCARKAGAHKKHRSLNAT
ncbi:MAG: hypothetical protein ISN28_07220 [Ectothiorhodospiraceae bacterium AqS1]|nr:hypothetical protein [Ectothiorhodospiraceae bacterium AqS1]